MNTQTCVKRVSKIHGWWSWDSVYSESTLTGLRTSILNLYPSLEGGGVSIGPYFIVKATYALISCREIHGLSDKGQAISE